MSYYIGEALKGKIKNVAGDAFCYNLVLVLLELCQPFLIHDSPMLEKIDPNYLIQGPRLNANNETPLCNKKYEDVKIEESAFDDESVPITSNYGTVTEFFFALSMGMNTLYSPILKRYEELDE